MNDFNSTQLNSPSWIFFVKINFAIAMGAMLVAIVVSPIELVIQGFLAMGTLYLVASTFTFSKTVRDEFEAQKLINKLAEARAEKLLQEYERESTAARA
jgi:hypothetical protein